MLPDFGPKCQCMNVIGKPFFISKHVEMIRDDCCTEKSFKTFFFFVSFFFSFLREYTMLFLWTLF